MHQILNISQGCRPERICMTISTHRHSAPNWDQEVSHLVKLDRHFHKFVPLYAVLTALTCIFPNCGSPRRARRSEGPFIAACGFNYYYFSGQFFAILRALPCSKTHETWHKNQSCDHLTYFIAFTSHGQDYGSCSMANTGMGPGDMTSSRSRSRV